MKKKILVIVVSFLIGFLVCILITQPTLPVANYILHGFGVFLGVIAGVTIMLLIRWIDTNAHKKRQLDNLRFEFELNIKKIDGWLEESRTLRNAINGGTINRYFGYFNLSRFVIVTTDKMFITGLLYEILDYDDIGKLQGIVSDFTIDAQNYHNRKITDIKEHFDQAEATSYVDYFEEKLRRHRESIQVILGKLV